MEFLKENIKIIENENLNILNDERIEPLLRETMHYILTGGKKLRASLLLETVKAVNSKYFTKDLIKVAAAIEMVHSYSLVHDDLPALDNDDFRRGKLTLHKKYNEAIAILTGDALLTHAFTYISETEYNSEIKFKLLKELAQASGPMGMIYGQVMDMEYKIENIETLKKLHSLKTGKMLILPIKFACIILNCSSSLTENLLKYAENLGIAFQASDDLLDVTGNSKKMGKTLHKDEKQNKVTYMDLFGTEGTKKEIKNLIDNALHYIKDYNFSRLEELALFIVKRES